MTDHTGSVVVRYDYDPYGRQTQLIGSLSSDFGFAGYYVHAPSGLNLTLFRAYDPDSGRWLNQDPIGERGGINLYDYVQNNPVNRVDPLGLWGIAFGNNSGSSYFNIGWGNPSLYFSPDVFNNPISGGVIASGSVEGGAGLGSGASLSGGGGLFYDPNNGVSVGGFQSAGAFAGSLSAVQSPSCNKSNPNFTLGSSVAIGSGMWLSNAGSPTDLGGPFDQWNLNTPFFSISFAISGDVWIGSLTTGGGSKASGGGYSVSSYPTTTYSAGGFNSSGQPIVYQP
jgi:RHS repeat-associated protein